MTQFGSQVQTAVHVRLASAAALDACTYSDTTAQIPANQDLGAKLVANAAGALTIDSVAAAVDDEVLVKDQSSTLQNGVYRVRSIGGTSSTWSLERSKQARDSGQFDGMIVTTGPSGSANPSAIFLYSGGVSPVIGTDAITFAAETGADLSLYAKLASPHFSGVPTAPTAAAGTNTTQLATTAFVLATVTADATLTALTEGATVTIDTPTYVINNYVLVSSGTITAATLALADGAFDGQMINVAFNHIITGLTVTGNTAATGLAQPTAATLGQSFGWQWDDVTVDWIRIR